MSVYQIYFSPTGGTEKVVKLIGGVWGEKTTVIDLSDTKEDFSKYSFEKEDVCIIGVPSFGGRVPEIALSHLVRMKGGNSRAVLAGVYGNRDYDDTLLELKDTLKAAGFCCFAAIAAVAEHSIMHQFGTGRPDAQDAEELKQFARNIKTAMEENPHKTEVNVPGDHPYREYHGVPFKPKAGKSCTSCGLCAEQCPVQAISKRQLQKTEERICISCMRCVMTCPQNARKLNKMVLAAASEKMKKVCSGRKENKLFIE